LASTKVSTKARTKEQLREHREGHFVEQTNKGGLLGKLMGSRTTIVI